MLRGNEAIADVLQEERSGAVGTLGGAGREAALAEQGRLLIARHARDWQPRGQKPERRRLAELGRAGQYTRQQRFRYTKEAAQVVVPGHLLDVQEQGAR